jgi:hypothetical protein
VWFGRLAILTPCSIRRWRFARLRERADVKRVDGVPAAICSLVDLVALKRAAGRDRDIADLEATHGELPTAGS